MGVQEFNQIQAKGRDRIAVLPHQPVELRSIRQLRKGSSQMVLSRALKGSFALKLDPLTKQGQRDDFAALQGSHWAREVFLMGMPRLAKIIDHDVQCWKVGIHIDHQLAPFLTNGFDKLTVRDGFLSFQVLSISHQTLKESGKRFSLGIIFFCT